MRGVRLRRRSITFARGYEEGRLHRWLYSRAINSRRLRAFALRLPISRLKTTLVGHFFHHNFHQWNLGNDSLVFQSVDPAVITEWWFGIFEGHAGLRQAWTEWQGSFGSARIEVGEILDAGNGEMVISLLMSGEGRTGMALTGQSGLIWTVRRGMATRCRFFSTKQQALEAAGLSE